MKIYLKPIQFPNLKEEIIINIEDNKKVSELIDEVYKTKPEAGNCLEFMFRGKKLLLEKTLAELGVKDGTKMMLYQSQLTSKPKESELPTNKETAKNSLINLGFQSDLVESVIKTMPNIDKLSQI